MLDQDQIARLLEIGDQHRSELLGSPPARTSLSESEGEEAASSTPANIADCSGSELAFEAGEVGS
jgi:hypothetical protein